MHTEDNIAYENSTHWVLDDPKKKFLEVYRIGLTHSERCAQIGRGLPDPLQRAIEEADRRHALVAPAEDGVRAEEEPRERLRA